MKAEKLIINGEEQELFDWNYNSLSNKPTLWTAASKDVGTSAWNVPILDANWKLDSNIVPSTWVMTSYTVTNKSDLTTLTTAVKWDIWIVTSENKTYILSNDPYSTLSNWTELLFPTGSVSSVNWFTWAVNLTTGYIQESNNNLFVSPTEKATWNNKLWANNVSTVALTGNYGDLNNKPVVDASLNASSTNAIQNWAVATAVNNINTTIGSIQWDITTIQGDITNIGTDKQDKLTAWTGIEINNNVITNTYPFNWANGAMKVFSSSTSLKEIIAWLDEWGGAVMSHASYYWLPGYDIIIGRFQQSSPTFRKVLIGFWITHENVGKITYYYYDPLTETDAGTSTTNVNFFNPSNWGTEWQVLTKGASGYWRSDTSSIVLEGGSIGTFLKGMQQAGTKHTVDMWTDKTYTFQGVGYVLISWWYGWACEINGIRIFYENFSSWTYTRKQPATILTMWPWDVVRLWRPWSSGSCTYTVADYY